MSSPVIKFTVLLFRHYYLTVAIIINVPNVRLQCRHKPTDDASTRHGVVHNRLVQLAPHRDQTLAQLVDVLDYAVIHTLRALFCKLFSGFGNAKIIEIC